MTTPSVTGVTVIGSLAGDYATNVHFEGRSETIWFAPELLAWVDHAPGTEVAIGSKKWVRNERGDWLEKQ